MLLAELIEQNTQALLDDWCQFARERGVCGHHLSTRELESSARDMLTAIAQDMRQDESNQSRIEKANEKSSANAPRLTHAARAHAQNRLSQGFTIDDVVAEYRALRADVTLRWRSCDSNSHVHDAEQLAHFDESIDQALAESVAHFSSRLSRLRDIFLGVLAHDLCTPLSAITLFAESIVRETGTPHRSVDAAVRIQRSAKQMQLLIDDLLDLTRTRFGEVIPITPAFSDMTVICEHAAAELRVISPSTDMIVNFEGNLRGVWDSGRLSQLVSNLLVNAVRHGRPGGPICLTATGSAPDVVAVTVANEGEAIPGEIMTSLFEPLVRTDSDSKPNAGAGLGLGLFIARQIALAHGGRLDVVSRDRQTSFCLSLPREKASLQTAGSKVIEKP